jgi:hydrogenase expression/formation protein HypE
MRDPTRGGVATALNELAKDTQQGIILREDALCVDDAVRGACELLGLDPLHIANEGQFLAVVSKEAADQALRALQKTVGGEAAKIIGEIQPEPRATVLCESAYGSSRVIDALVGDPLPRIC